LNEISPAIEEFVKADAFMKYLKKHGADFMQQ